MPLDLKTMSRKDLLKLRADVEKALIAAEHRDRDAALKAAENAAAEFGFSLGDLSGAAGGSKRKGGKRPKALPKYSNPADPTQTWSGLGRKPKWIHEALASGTNISDLAI